MPSILKKFLPAAFLSYDDGDLGEAVRMQQASLKPDFLPGKGALWGLFDGLHWAVTMNKAFFLELGHNPPLA